MHDDEEDRPGGCRRPAMPSAAKPASARIAATRSISRDETVAREYVYYNGDRILVSKFAYDFSPPQRWDVIVFKYPEDAKTNYIKRLIGLPNDVIRIRDGDIAVSHDDGKTFAYAAAQPRQIAVDAANGVRRRSCLPAVRRERLAGGIAKRSAAAGGAWTAVAKQFEGAIRSDRVHDHAANRQTAAAGRSLAALLPLRSDSRRLGVISTTTSRLAIDQISSAAASRSTTTIPTTRRFAIAAWATICRSTIWPSSFRSTCSKRRGSWRWS